MAEIQPFRGLFYNPAKVGALERVVAPPYDVITPETQEALYAASLYNVVRIILNREERHDDGGDNPYTRAAGFFREWLASGVLIEETEPALYVYRQRFTNPADGKRYTRTGFFCALRLEPYTSGVVLPHEETRTRAKEDRLRLMRATALNPEPIFGLYEDPDGYVANLWNLASAPDIQVTVDGDEHAVWRVADKTTHGHVQAFLRDRRIWIADGHHRYETALAYRDEIREARRHAPTPHDTRSHPEDYILIVLVPFNDPGLVVLPTHRMVKNIPAGRMEQLFLLLERYFEIQPVSLGDLPGRMEGRAAPEQHRFGMITRQGAFVLSLRDVSILDTAIEGHAAVWKRLDVSILQALVLERSLGIPASLLATTSDIGYTRDREEAVARVRAGEYQLAFLLNRPHAEEVRQVAAAGEKMPPKSTFFYPKLWSGLLLRRLESIGTGGGR